MGILLAFTGMFLSVLAADLLYLYYIGVWHDPIRLIEVAEIVILYILIGLGLFSAYKGVKWQTKN